MNESEYLPDEYLQEENLVTQVARSWGWALAFGLLTVVVGVLVMVWPQTTLKVLAVLFGLQLFLAGIYRFALAFAVDRQHRGWSIVVGILSVIVGVIVIRNLVETVTVLALILGLYWIVSGIVQTIMAIGDRRHPQRGFSIFLGLVTLAAGIVIVAYPVGTATALAWLLGVWLVILGVLGIVLSFQLRRAAEPPERVVAA